MTRSTEPSKFEKTLNEILRLMESESITKIEIAKNGDLSIGVGNPSVANPEFPGESSE